MCIVWHALELTCFVVLSKVTIQFFCRTAGLIAPTARPQGGMLPSLCSMPLPDLFISLVPSYCHILLSFVHFRPLHTICWPLLLLIPYGLNSLSSLCSILLEILLWLRWQLGVQVSSALSFLSRVDRNLSSLCPVVLGWVPTAEWPVPNIVIYMYVIVKHITILL